MTARERARLIAMYGVIAGLHVAGFVILFVFVVPSHYKGLGVGVAVLGERQGTGAPRPLGFGFFFSLGTPPSWSPSGPGS